MKKEEVLAQLQSQKQVKVDAVSADADAVIQLVASIEVDAPVESDALAQLQAQVDDLKAQLQAKSDELDALKAVEASEHVDLDAVKADLEVVKGKLVKDEEALGKFKAILAALQDA